MTVLIMLGLIVVVSSVLWKRGYVKKVRGTVFRITMAFVMSVRSVVSCR